MRDTFTSVFPAYNHGEPTIFKSNRPSYQTYFVYPKRNDDGRITHLINREFTHKIDAIKEYSESMTKIADMRR